MPQVLFDGDPDFRTGFAFAEAMLERGVYEHPWHNMFLCAAMTEADMTSQYRRRTARSPFPCRARTAQTASATGRLLARRAAGR